MHKMAWKLIIIEIIFRKKWKNRKMNIIMYIVKSNKLYFGY